MYNFPNHSPLMPLIWHADNSATIWNPPSPNLGTIPSAQQTTEGFFLDLRRRIWLTTMGHFLIRNVIDAVKLFKKDNKRVVTATFYGMEVASLCITWLVFGCEGKLVRLYFSWTKGRLSEAKSAVATIFSLKHTKNGFYFTIYHVVLRPLYVKVKSEEIYEEISFPSFFRKLLISALCRLRFYSRLIVLKNIGKATQAMHGYKTLV